MSTTGTTYDDPAVTGKAIEREARELLGQVMGFVAVTVGFAALGAYLGRDLSGAVGLVLFIGAFACIFGLHIAATKGREQLAIGLMFALGLLCRPIRPNSSLSSTELPAATISGSTSTRSATTSNQ